MTMLTKPTEQKMIPLQTHVAVVLAILGLATTLVTASMSYAHGIASERSAIRSEILSIIASQQDIDRRLSRLEGRDGVRGDSLPEVPDATVPALSDLLRDCGWDRELAALRGGPVTADVVAQGD